MADQLNAKGRQEPGCNGAQCYACGCFPCTGAFQHRPGLIEAVLLHTGEIRVTGPRPGQGGITRRFLQDSGIHRVGGHDLFPLGPFGVSHLDGYRTALGQTVADSPDNSNLVLFELHPGASAVAEPAARQSRLDGLAGDLHACRHSLNDSDKSRAVGFPGRQPTQHTSILPRPKGATSAGAHPPRHTSHL